MEEDILNYIHLQSCFVGPMSFPFARPHLLEPNTIANTLNVILVMLNVLAWQLGKFNGHHFEKKKK